MLRLQLGRVEWNITRNFFQAAMRAIDSRLFTLTTSGTFQSFCTTFGVEFAAVVVGRACVIRVFMCYVKQFCC